MFDEQIDWAVEADVDYVIAETFSFAQEALVALEAIKAHAIPSVVTLALHAEPVTREGWTPEEACRRLADAGADVVGLNCIRGPRTMLPVLRAIRGAVAGHVAALPVPYRTTPEQPSFQSLLDPGCDCIPGGRPFPTGPRPVHLQPLRDRRVRTRGVRPRHPLSRRLLRRRPPSHPQPCRGTGANAAGEAATAPTCRSTRSTAPTPAIKDEYREYARRL
jgi:hypothetical protein